MNAAEEIAGFAIRSRRDVGDVHAWLVTVRSPSVTSRHTPHRIDGT
jgi:hypothetical protein